MQTRSFLQRRSNSESSDRVVASIKPRSWGDEIHEQPESVQPQNTGFDFKNADWFSHDPGSRPTPSVLRSIQAKLTVGAPNDRYEQEADRVAEQVMSTPDSVGHKPIQRESMPEEEEELQMKPLAATITPLVQREVMPEEEELQTKALGDSIQREAMPEEEEELQAKPLDTSIQREAMLEEEEIQTKRSPDAGFQAGSNLESRLSSSQGGGSPLSDEVRSFMEPRFGADFSQVRVHTGSESLQMNQDLNAQAFTHKQNVYFGDGKAPAKDALTAHELTHVVQQAGAVQTKEAPNPNVQLKCSACDEEPKVQRSIDISSTPEAIQRREVCDDEGVCRSEPDPVESSGFNVVTLPEIVIEGDPNNSEQEKTEPSPENVQENETGGIWNTVKEGAAGVAYGTMQGLTPGGFAAPSPMPKSRTFEFFRGAGQIAGGAAGLVGGVGGEVAGTVADATGVGALVGVPLNVVSAVAAANGATSIIAGGGTIAHAMSMGDGTGGKADTPEGTQTSPYGKDDHGLVWAEPQTIAEQVAMDAAKSGEGKVVMRGSFDDLKYKDPGWEKWEYRTTTADGNKIEIHYMKNTITGQTDQFKFLSRGSYPKPALDPKSP